MIFVVFFSSRFQPLERPKSEVPVTSVAGPQSSHLAIRYDPKLEQPRSGVRAVPIAQAKQSSSSSTTAATQHEVNRVIVQKPEPLRFHHQQQQHQVNNNQPHRSSTTSDDHHLHHHKRPASVQPSYLESRPFQIKPYDGGNNNSNGSSSNGSSGSGHSSYHRPFTVTPQPLPPSSQSSAAIIVSGMDHRWATFDGRAPPAFLQHSSSSSSSTSSSGAPVINGYHHHQRPPPSSSTATVVTQHHQHHSLSRQQQQSQHYPLNLHKLTQPARPATAAGQLQQVSGVAHTLL